MSWPCQATCLKSWHSSGKYRQFLYRQMLTCNFQIKKKTIVFPKSHVWFLVCKNLAPGVIAAGVTCQEAEPMSPRDRMQPLQKIKTLAAAMVGSPQPFWREGNLCWWIPLVRFCTMVIFRWFPWYIHIPSLKILRVQSVHHNQRLQSWHHLATYAFWAWVPMIWIFRKYGSFKPRESPSCTMYEVTTFRDSLLLR